MSIELKSSHAPSKTASAGESGHVKGKPHAAGDGGPADTGDFLSLLMSLDAETVDTVVVAEGDAVLPSAAEDALLKDPAVNGAVLADDPRLSQAVDPALLLAQSMQTLPVTPQEARALPATPQTGLMPPPQALARLAGSPEASALAGQLAEPVAEAPRTSEVNGKRSSRPGTMEMGAQMAARTQASDAGRTADPRFSSAIRLDVPIEAHAALPAMLATAPLGAESGIKQMERLAEKFGDKQVGGAEGAWGYQALLSGARVDSAVASTGAAMPSAETMVAEQVKYWISSDVQNAELTLDGFGQDPVEVSISLTGMEARVEFRTDQPEVRQILEGSTTHLKDLLQNEGMVLSGVSVGSSGQDARSGEQERKQRPHNGPVKQATVMAPALLAASAGSGPNRLTGRSIDLFV